MFGLEADHVGVLLKLQLHRFCLLCFIQSMGVVLDVIVNECIQREGG